MSPRPILKSLPTAPPQPMRPSFRAGHVHFPPTPDLSATYLAHSARFYDRSAIVVSPNQCALPQRNCPDRTYVLSEGKGEAHLLLKSVEPEGEQVDGDDAEDTPGAEDRIEQRTDYFSVTPPPLTPDFTSSESEDSDGLISPPDEREVELERGLPSVPILNFPISSNADARDAAPSHEDVQSALAFLPHPLPPASERKRSPSPHDRDRKKERAHSFSDTENGTPLPARRPRALSFTPEVPPDLGCLGGF